MTARQYLLSESEYCRRLAEGCDDPFVAAELRRLAEEFEQTARAALRAVGVSAEQSSPAGMPGTFQQSSR